MPTSAEGTYGATGRSGRLFRMGSAILSVVMCVRVRNERLVASRKGGLRRRGMVDQRSQVVEEGLKDRIWGAALAGPGSSDRNFGEEARVGFPGWMVHPLR